MNRETKRIPAIILALTLCLSGITGIIALENPQIPQSTGDEQNPAKAAITKLLKTPIGTDVSRLSFMFTVTPDSVDGVAYDYDTPNMPTVNDIVMNDFHSLDTYTGEAMDAFYTRYIYKEKTINFIGDWPHAGVYEYTIYELLSSNAIERGHDELVYSGAQYKLRVYVRQNEAGAGYYPEIITAERVLDDDSRLVSVKVDPTPGGPRGDYGDGDGDGNDVSNNYSQMVFTNKYMRTNGSTVPDEPKLPTELPKAALEIKKMIAGGYANSEDYFTFKIKLTQPALVSELYRDDDADDDEDDDIEITLGSGGLLGLLGFRRASATGLYLDVTLRFRGYVVDADGTTILGAAELQDLAKNNVTATVATDKNGRAYIVFPSGTETELNLKAGQKLVFFNTPVGTKYVAEETGKTGYVPSYQIKYGTNENAGSATGALNSGLSTANNPQAKAFVGEPDSKANFTNTRNDITPTGLNLNDLPFIGMIVLAGLGIAGYIVAKSRRGKKHR